MVEAAEADFLGINYLAVHSFSSFLTLSDFLADAVLDQVLVALLIEGDVTKNDYTTLIIPNLTHKTLFITRYQEHSNSLNLQGACALEVEVFYLAVVMMAFF